MIPRPYPIETSHGFCPSTDTFYCAHCARPRAFHADPGFKPSSSSPRFVCMDESARYRFDKRQILVPGRRRGLPFDEDEYRPR